MRNAVIWSCMVVFFISASARGDFIILGYDTTNPNGAAGAPSPNLAAAESQYLTPLSLSRGAGPTPNQGVVFS